MECYIQYMLLSNVFHGVWDQLVVANIYVWMILFTLIIMHRESMIVNLLS